MTAISIAEFRPTIIFLVKFVGIYLVGNLLYGAFVSAYKPTVDPVTSHVTFQTSEVLSLIGYETEIVDQPAKATTHIQFGKRSVVSVYEGCNGINVFVIFLAFIVAFGPLDRRAVFFSIAAATILHIANLLRIGGLFLIALHQPRLLYFTHKYLFTAFIYAVVIALWLWWVNRYAVKKQNT